MSTITLEDLRGLRITVMGLGLNGGGLNAARFLAAKGAIVTVTDMKDEEALAPSIAKLEGLPIRYVLGRHDLSDFSEADMVIKNPAVRPDSPYLAVSRRVETDLSLFLSFCPAPVLAITGSKGKSTTATALHYALNACGIKAHLGGNITLSPLSFLDQVMPEHRVVLELSSWQLGDLKGMGLLKPKAAVLTRIVPDHLDRYPSMEAYVADKRLIYADQDKDDWTICEADEDWGRSFASETGGRVLGYGGEAGQWTEDRPGASLMPDGSCQAVLPGLGRLELFPAAVRVPGEHNRRNLMATGLAAWAAGADPGRLGAALASFPGVEHRLEAFLEREGLRWVNDSAATVPEAVAAALGSFSGHISLITGGTDKNLDYRPVRSAYARANTLVLLAGSGSEKLMALLREDGIAYLGPCSSIEEAIRLAAANTPKGGTVMLSPGATSFGMFKNEFDRGARYKAAVRAYYGLA